MYLKKLLMSCVDAQTEFNSTRKKPVFCDDDVNTKTGCNMWDGAVGALQCGLTANCSDMPIPNKINHGIWQTPLSQCERIQSNQVLSYGKGDKFDIRQLKDGWTGGSWSGIQCDRTLYGAFQKNGCRAGTGSDTSKCAQAKNTSVYDYWQSLQQSCQSTMKTLDKTNGKTTPGEAGPYTKAFENFSTATMQDGSSTAIQLNFNCEDSSALMYTQCKRPGWDMMGYQGGKGWVAQKSCSQNPLHQYNKLPIDCPNQATTSPSNDDSGCSEGFNKCNDGDLRPSDPNNPGCCMTCDDWKQVYPTYFSYKEAIDTQNMINPKTSTSYQQYLTEQCTGPDNCCLTKTTTSETSDDDICKLCEAKNTPADMSKSEITIAYGNGIDSVTLQYVDNDSGKGVAITPTVNTSKSIPPSGFNDVRECLNGQKFEGQCQGLTGCYGVTPYCKTFGCLTNACNEGLNYNSSSGGDQNNLNPALNCPNVYTLARNTDPACPVDTNYDNTNPKLHNIKSMTIPEGAWVTGYFNNVQTGNWNNARICEPSDGGLAVMMGCGQETQNDGTSKLTAYATAFTLDDKGNYHVEEDKKATTLHNGTKLYESTVVKSKVENNTCTFTGLDQANDYIKADDEQYIFAGYTFGFMPGYYNPKYTTSTGPCGDIE